MFFEGTYQPINKNPLSRKDFVMSKNTRRQFLQQGAGAAAVATGAVLLGSSALAQSPAADVLTSAELASAAELVAQMGGAPGVVLLVLNHVDTLARQGRTQDVANAVAVMRARIVGSDNPRAAKRLTDDALSALRD